MSREVETCFMVFNNPLLLCISSLGNCRPLLKYFVLLLVETYGAYPVVLENIVDLLESAVDSLEMTLSPVALLVSEKRSESGRFISPHSAKKN